MKLTELSIEEFTDIYNRYMVRDFPKDELKPLKRITDTMKTGLSCAYGMFEGTKLIGYAVFVLPDGLQYGLLDYLAVLREYRGTGVGHAFFELINDTLVRKCPTLKGFFIESESIDFAQNDTERRIREKRISFYLQNQCERTALGSELFGVTYSVLVYRFNQGVPKLPGREDLDKVYRAMFQKHHYENEVEIWEKV
ncbi:MAG: GNAT family N-acetyltransferase [Lachnospiraceae bacterium]|nr:GNAT family N-acetyltransferase [Lachnospiraceae bacterium]MBO5146862.1 GNAT family N-acetyltransferase [Lachnospiraceae bacterium]